MIFTPSSQSPFEIPTTLGASYRQPCRRTHPIVLLFVLIVALNTRHSDDAIEHYSTSGGSGY
ncbi:hypothetical protein OUZ56_032836 [Daphnia magna]|uniref:Uncharacterized protein n=1 Tax=Daphnia magna TaxID=35525 RepID=A0ABR0B9P2_9CRUS|nr:hypothetical protein OUZ56_032836 [Daphnia magna]